MFKTIGLVVVIAILLIGFGPLQKWYRGDATPEEAVNEIRQRVGESVAGDSNGAGALGSINIKDERAQPLAVERPFPDATRSDMPLTAEGKLKKLMEDK